VFKFFVGNGVKARESQKRSCNVYFVFFSDFSKRKKNGIDFSSGDKRLNSEVI